LFAQDTENQWIFLLGKPLKISGKINLFTLLIDTMMSFCVKFPVKFGIETDHHLDVEQILKYPEKKLKNGTISS